MAPAIVAMQEKGGKGRTKVVGLGVMKLWLLQDGNESSTRRTYL